MSLRQAFSHRDDGKEKENKIYTLKREGIAFGEK